MTIKSRRKHSGTAQHDARTQCLRLRGLAPQGQCRELLALCVAQHELRFGSASHDHLVVLPHYTIDQSTDNKFNEFLTQDTSAQFNNSYITHVFVSD